MSLPETKDKIFFYDLCLTTFSELSPFSLVVDNPLCAVVVAVYCTGAFFSCVFLGEEGDLPQADQGGQEQAEEDPRHRSPYRQAQSEEGR